MIAVNEFTIVKIYDGEDGNDGVSVVKVVPEYTVHTSFSSLPPNPNWSETKPDTVDSTHYLWTRQRTDLSNGSHEYSNAVCDIVISGIISNVDRNTNSITNKVWESDITTEISNWDTTNRIRDRVSGIETNINGITLRVSDVESETDSLGTRMNSAESSITQNANKISAMVSVNGQTSAITLTNKMIEAITEQFVIKGSDNTTTVISGGKISANSIKTGDLATDAIKSNNYQAGNANSHFSAAGSFLNLANGNFYTPYFTLNNTGAYFSGEVVATSLTIAPNATVDGVPTTDEMNSTISDAISDIQVGGRNLIRNTNIIDLSSNAKMPNINGDTTNGRAYGSGGTMTSAEHGVRYTIGSADRPFIAFGPNNVNAGLHGLATGKTYTWSFDYTVKTFSGTPPTTSSYYLRAYLGYVPEGESAFNTSQWKNIHQFAITDLSDRGSEISGHGEFTFELPEGATAMRFWITTNSTNTSYYASGDFIELRNIKLEEGNKATAWSPAPEDFNQAVNNISTELSNKITTFYQTSNPSAPIATTIGDLWIDTGDNNKLYRWNGTNWISIQDANIQKALIDASAAQSTADKKIVTYAQSSRPTEDLGEGDLWIDIDDNNKMYRWSGTDWVDYTDSSAIANLTIGGRNLFINTLSPDSDGPNRPMLIKQESNTAVNGTAYASEHGIGVRADTVIRPYIRFGSIAATSDTKSMNGLVAGKTYTISFDCKWKLISAQPSGTTTQLRCVVYDDHTTTGTLNWRNIKLFATATACVEDSGRCEATFTLADNVTMMALAIVPTESTASCFAIGDYIELNNLKLEEGDKATSWTPAIEDTNNIFENMQTNLDNLNNIPYETIPYYLRTSYNDITRVSINDIFWRTDMPELTSNYPYLWEYYVDRYGDGVNGVQNIELEGSSISFVNHGDMSPIESVVLNIEAKQSGSGDPSPTNIRPITNYDQASIMIYGKNLLPYPYYNTTKTENGITWTVNDDGSITINGTATDQSTFALTKALTSSSLRTNGGKYMFGLGVDGQSDNTFFVTGTFADINKENVKYLHNITDIFQPYYEFDTSVCGDSGYFGQLYIRVRSGVTMNNITVYPMLYVANTDDSTYEPYALHNAVITTLESDIGYGVFDLTNGEVKINKRFVELNGSELWAIYSNGFRVSVGSANNKGKAEYNNTTDFSNWLKVAVSNNPTSPNAEPNTFLVGSYINVSVPEVTTIEDFKALLASRPLQIVYELETPIVYNVTPDHIVMAEGVNNIYSNTNNIVINYYDYQKVRGVYYNNTVSSLFLSSNELEQRVNINEENIETNKSNFESGLLSISNDLKNSTDELTETIDAMDSATNDRFDSVDAELNSVDIRLENVASDVEENSLYIKDVKNIFKVDPDTGVYVLSSADSNTYFNTTYNTMRFVVEDNETMIIHGDTSVIQIGKAQVNEMDIGNFRWEAQSDGSLILKEGVLNNGNNSN